MNSLKTMNPVRKRVQISFKGTISKTKPEYTRSSDINNIVKQGLPAPTPLTFGDISNLPDLFQAFNTVQKAKDLFNQLPANVRKLIDNDPSKLQGFIADKSNQDFLIKEGVLTPPKKVEPSLKADPPAVAPPEEKPVKKS